MNRTHVKYVLVGGGPASSAAAEGIRALDPEGSILLIGQEVNRPYHRPPLSKQYLRGQMQRAQMFTVNDDWFTKNRVELRTGRRVAQLDPSRHSISLDSGDVIVYDKLLLATGATPRHLKIPGEELPNVFYLRTLEDADRLHHGIEKAQREGRTHEKGRGRAAIVGSGLLAAELSATFAQMGLHVDLVCTAAQLYPKFAGETAAKAVAAHMEQRGVKLHLNASPLRLEGDGRVQRVVLPEKTLEVDLVVPAAGITPHKELLRGTSLKAEKSILVDEFCRTSDPDVYAAGDCAAIFDPRIGKYRPLEHLSAAVDTGALAGRNMAGATLPYAGVNHFWSDVFDVRMEVWGEGRHIARRIVRGGTQIDSPDFIEFGLSADDRLSLAIAINHPAGDHDTLRELVRRRTLLVAGDEERFKDPAVPLESFLN